MPAKENKAPTVQKDISKTSYLTGEPNPSEDDTKREKLWERFWRLKGEVGDIFIEIEEEWRNCRDWEQLSENKEAWEDSRKRWKGLYLELRWELVFHHFGFLPPRYREQCIKKLNQVDRDLKKPPKGKRGRRSLREDENERLLMTKVAWWNFVQDVSLEAATDKLREQGLSFHGDETHKTQYVQLERKRAVEAIYGTLRHWGLMPSRYTERMEELEMREGQWYAKEELN